MWTKSLQHALPWCLMGLALWFAYSAFTIGVADLIYPQERPLQPRHWVFSMAPSQQRQRLERALAWTPSNTWYWQALGHVSRHAEADANDAAGYFRHALTHTPTNPYLHLAQHRKWQTTATPLSISQSHRIADLAPADPEVQYRIGTVLQDRAALPFFRRAMALHPAYYDKTLKAYLKRYPDPEAILWFSRAIPDTSQGHVQAAQRLEPISWPHARYHYLRAIAFDKTNANVIRQFANALQAHQDDHAAANMWHWLQSLTPDDPMVYRELADHYRRRGNHDQWLETLRQLTDRFPRHSPYRDQLADAYLQLGEPEMADEIWHELTQIEPQSTVGYLGLVKSYTARQRTDEAIAMMQKVIDLAPGTIKHHRRLAQLYEQTGANARALHEYKRLAALRPNDPWALFYLGEHLRQAGAYARAVTYFQRAHDLDPTQAIYLYQLGRAYASRGEHHLAIDAYQRALVLNAKDYNAHYQLGLSYHHTGQPALARHAFGQVIRLAPDPRAFPVACQHIRCNRAPSSH